MRQSARQLEEPSGFGALLREGLLLSGGAIIRNPVTVGGATAFLVALGFISANALWYQPHFHDDAFFATRAPAPAAFIEAPIPHAALREPMSAEPATFELTSVLQPAPDQGDEGAIAAPIDPVVGKVQSILKGLNLYSGAVDGLAGPQTSAAIQTYQRIIGLEQNGRIDDALLAQLGAAPADNARNVDPSQVASVAVPQEAPVPLPRPGSKNSVDVVATSAPDANIVRIQAGLKAFGNDGIELDGKVGARTRGAIEEFQSLFGLPVTGEPDQAVYAKMREIGLTD